MQAIETAFMQHVGDYGLSYGTVEEYNFRMKQYMAVDSEIKEHNAANNTHTLGHNFMSTWTQAEKKRLNGYVAPTIPAKVEVFPTSNASSVNWVTAGAVTGVKNQGSCGSCWSFSTTGAVEGAHQIKSKKLLSFSEQQLVDCSTLNHGCNGGSMALAFRYLESHFAELESEYPYTSGTTRKAGTCKYDSKSKTSVEVSKYSNVTQNNPDQLKAAIAVGPTSVAIEADKTVFQHYTSGVITSSSCGTNLDHGVLAAGYGTENGQQYFLVKNSWGASWGDKGYVKIGVASGKGICGINEDPCRPSSN